MNNNILTLLEEWLQSLKSLHRGHWDAARAYEQRNFLLGLLATIFAAISGATAFATLAESPSVTVRFFIGLFSLAAATIASLQTYFRSSEQAERHKAAGVKYGALRREIEKELIFVQADDAEKQHKKVESFRTRWNAIDEESPAVPANLYKRAKQLQKRESSPTQKPVAL